MKATVINSVDHSATIAKMIKEGKTIITVLDNDDKIWESGLANYLMTNYDYYNTRVGFRVNILKRR